MLLFKFGDVKLASMTGLLRKTVSKWIEPSRDFLLWNANNNNVEYTPM